MRFVNYTFIDHELWNKIIYDVGKSYRGHLKMLVTEFVILVKFSEASIKLIFYYFIVSMDSTKVV